ncbi:hypothetical protein C3L55_08085, partial [Veillonellaceae bacterium M1-70]|nr:hypothetical protein [Veillonellaceae bacterium M1-70]
ANLVTGGTVAAAVESLANQNLDNLSDKGKQALTTIADTAVTNKVTDTFVTDKVKKGVLLLIHLRLPETEKRSVRT